MEMQQEELQPAACVARVYLLLRVLNGRMFMIKAVVLLIPCLTSAGILGAAPYQDKKFKK